MEKEALKTAMKGSISEVLEKMFFLPLDFYDAAKPEEIWRSGKDETLAIKLKFKGLFAGYFVFIIPRKLAVSITDSFLGKDEDDPAQEHVIETIKEITNMIAGNTFSKFNDQATFDLGLPEPIQFKEAERIDSASEEEIFFGINTLDNWLALQLVICS